MMINKIACAAFAAAAMMMCQGGVLFPVASDSYTDYDTDSSYDWDEDEEEERELDDDSDLSFSFEDEFPEEIGGYEVLTEFLPDGVGLEWTGKKLKAPKAGKVKYSKKEESFVDTKDSDNPSGLKLSISKKTGTVKGSFKVYVAKSEKKLKSYTAKVTGIIGGDGLTVTIKNGGAYGASLE